MSKTVLVTGATGKQGGAVIRGLQDSPDTLILALTRNTSSPSAQRLAALENVKLVQGDLSDPSAIFTNAKEVAKRPVWGVYFVQANDNDKDGSIEETQGKAFVNAAIAAKVQHFVYASVDRGNSQGPTQVPTWDAKARIEKLLEQRAPEAGMSVVMLRPTGFMENLSDDFFGKVLSTAWRQVLKEKPMQLVAVKDIGYFGAQALKYPDEFAGRYVSLAGASLTWEQANNVFKSKIGKDMPTTFGIVPHIVLKLAKEFQFMFKWLKNEGNTADVEECKRLHPGLLDFGTWLVTESDFKTQ
ncbi:hypothetical protein BDV96DRAFT_499826 [Lophiotrema nucula]|uniref:NmrA-like domain-containing protein n=1 Tax=Lophiotrema nucula TaxID=690887 RepID=A0A6A5YWA2_9PLEO|nr:hypothetical protein BDV96DRAFT_499826 [Lophiotrema nucula]